MSDTPPFPSPTKRWHSKAQPSTLPTRPELSAKGKSVLVTGGGTGIGGETARYFAEAGASRIALLGRREQRLLENKAFIEARFPGVEVLTLTADITKKADVDAAFARFAGGGSKVDVLVHSAAVAGPQEAVDVVDGEAYLEALHANVAGALWVAQAFVRHAAPDAVAIAINSWLSYLSLNDSLASYGVAKMAVFRLWDTVAYKHPNLSIFHTQPGMVLTEMNQNAGGADNFSNVKFDDGKWNGSN